MSKEQSEMKIDVNRAKALASNLQSVLEKVSKEAKGRNVCFITQLQEVHTFVHFFQPY